MFENVVLQRNSRNSEILIANYKLRRETIFEGEKDWDGIDVENFSILSNSKCIILFFENCFCHKVIKKLKISCDDKTNCSIYIYILFIVQS